MVDPGCPDTRLDRHSACGKALQNTFIHEEYLGLFEQEKDDIRRGFYCITPRKAYTTMAQLWQGVGYQEYENTICRYYVTITDPPFIYLELLFIFLLGSIIIGLIFCGQAIRNRSAEKRLKAGYTSIGDVDRLSNDNAHVDIDQILFDLNLLHSMREDERPAYSEPIIKRMTSLIRDNTELLNSSKEAIKATYVRYMEGYLLWSSTSYKTIDTEFKANPDLAIAKYLFELASFMVIQLEAGSINHCPNLINAVFSHYLADPTRLDLNDLRSLFRFFYTIIEKHDFSFDDLDNYGNKFRKSKSWADLLGCLNRFSSSIPTSMIEASLDGYAPLAVAPSPITTPVTTGEINRAESLKEQQLLKAQAAKLYVTPNASVFLSLNTITTTFNFKRNWIGSYMALFFNFTWLLRLDVWLMVLAWFCQPLSATSFRDVTVFLAFTDSILMLLSSFTQLVLLRSHLKLRHFLIFLWRVVLFILPVLDFPDVYLSINIATILCSEIFFVSYRIYIRRTQGRLLAGFGFSIGQVFRYFLRMLSVFTAILISWIFFFYILIPSFIHVNYGLCDCPLDGLINSPEQTYICSFPAKASCTIGFVLVWMSSMIVSIIIIYSSFVGLMLIIGVIEGKRQSIGSINSWSGMSGNVWTQIKEASVVMLGDEALRNVWKTFIHSLRDESLISEDEKSLLIDQSFDVPPTNAEARRRIVNFANNIQSLLQFRQIPDERVALMAELRKRMPSLTVLVPHYAEEVIYDCAALRKTTPRKPISDFEYLMFTYLDEWEIFCKQHVLINELVNVPQSVIASAFQSGNYDALRKAAIKAGIDPASLEDTFASIEWKIRLWCSMHGQTLFRTLRGFYNLRVGLENLGILDRRTTSVDRFQVVVTHQTFQSLRTEAKNELRFLQQKLGFDLCYIGTETDPRGRKKVVSYCERAVSHTIARSVDDLYTYSPVTEPLNDPVRVVRPGGFIGEGKAENQMHALVFARNTVYQAFDMNQYFTMENALFVPFVLYDYFNTSAAPYVPKYRILGFPEYTYSRPLGGVAEYMGMAEFAFVTILQRTLTTLQARMHYGHPDFFDGYWVYSRGGPSKATKKVNMNEDVFAGYEVAARGEKIGYVQYLQAQKGRESGFNAATLFLTKLAQGAAQQVLSKDVFHLNETLPHFSRFSLFFGGLGFYVTNYMMVTSIFCYLYSLIFFAIADVSYHQLGLVGSAIAVPWLIQIGFIQMFPVLIEMMMEDGLFQGLIHFLINLPFSLIFFLFQIKTTSFHFEYGLTTGQGGYKTTGRGFELERSTLKNILQRYTKSHFLSALKLLFGVLFYFLVADEDFATKFVRMLSIILILLSWMLAPIIFNPFPNTVQCAADLKETLAWLGVSFPLFFDMSSLIERATAHDPLKSMPEPQGRRNELNESTRQKSWEFDFWLEYLEGSRMPESVIQSNLSFIAQNLLTLLKWFVFSFFSNYVMIGLTVVKLWSVDTIPVVVLVLGFIFIILLSQQVLSGSAQGVYSGFAIILLFLTLTYWYLVVRTVDTFAVFMSLLLDLVLLFLLDEVLRGFIYVCFVLGLRSINYELDANSNEMTHLANTKFFGNISPQSVPFCCFYVNYRPMIRFVAQFSKLFPTLLASIFYVTDYITQIIGGFLTSVLYNSRIAHRWLNLEYNYSDGSSASGYSVHQKVVRLMKSQVEYNRLSEIVLPSTLMTAVGATQVRNDELDSLVSGGTIYSSILDAAAESLPPRFMFFNCAVTHLLVNHPNKFALLKEIQWINDPQFFIFPITNNRSDFVSGDWSILICDIKGKESVHFDPFDKNKRIGIGISNLLDLESSTFSFHSFFSSNAVPLSESGLICVKVLENLQAMANARTVEEIKTMDLSFGTPQDYRTQIEASFRSLSAKNKIKPEVQELNTRFIRLLGPGFGEERSLDASALLNKAKKVHDKTSGESKNRAALILRRSYFLLSSFIFFSCSHNH